MKYQAPFGSADPAAPYVDRNTPAAVSGSKVPAGFPNWVQNELVNVIIKAGFVPDDVLQLASAIQSQKLNFAIAGGTANALTATLAPAPAAITAGMVVNLKIATTNTGAATLNVNGTGVIPVTNPLGGAAAPGDLPAGAVMAFLATGPSWMLVGPALSQIQKASVGQQQIFTSGGTFTVPAGVTMIKARVQGGGGGGAGGGGVNTFVGGGGAAGGYAEKFIAVSPGDTFAVAIGAGGAGGGNLGGTGGTTSFGAAVSATGGSGGKGNSGAGGDCSGGVGGTGVSGSLIVLGGDGGDGNSSSTSIQGGNGGASYFGGGGRTGTVGLPGKSYGSGAGGCWGSASGSGGVGATGVCIVEW